MQIVYIVPLGHRASPVANSQTPNEIVARLPVAVLANVVVAGVVVVVDGGGDPGRVVDDPGRVVVDWPGGPVTRVSHSAVKWAKHVVVVGVDDGVGFDWWLVYILIMIIIIIIKYYNNRIISSC